MRWPANFKWVAPSVHFYTVTLTNIKFNFIFILINFISI